MSRAPAHSTPPSPASGPRSRPARGPFIHAPERAQSIYLVTCLAAGAPLAAGIVLFGWRSLVVTAISVGGCVLFERAYFRLTRTPALLGRTHAYLTGLLLALTLPPFVPWYVPLVGAAFATLLGKAVFGGVGHFLWQPALVGRLAVAVLFGATLNPANWPLLSANYLLVGDVRDAVLVEPYQQWRGATAPAGASGFLLPRPVDTLRALTAKPPAYSALAYVPADLPSAQPAALLKLPPINDLLYGATGGGIGETCAIVIAVAGLCLVYRSYVRWQLPLAVLAGAAAVVAVAPVYLADAAGTVRTVWWPIGVEGLDVGLTYVSYHLLGGELMLAAFFLAAEMTTRPITVGGQIVFGLCVGALAMLLRLYVNTAVPCYVAVLAMNTLVPILDGLFQPRVLGRRRFAWVRRGQQA